MVGVRSRTTPLDMEMGEVFCFISLLVSVAIYLDAIVSLEPQSKPA